jgi:hypothetical protein
VSHTEHTVVLEFAVADWVGRTVLRYLLQWPYAAPVVFETRLGTIRIVLNVTS